MSLDLVVEPDEVVSMARQLQVEFAGASYHVVVGKMGTFYFFVLTQPFRPTLRHAQGG